MLQYTLNFPKQPANFPGGFVDYLASLPLCTYLESAFSETQYQEAIQKLEKFTHIIHLGTGGSSLGPQALYAIADEPTKTFTFFDNIDPDGFHEKLKNIYFSKTGLLVA